MTKISVIIPTHNPDPGRMQATLRGLKAQTLPNEQWELLVVDNASVRFPDQKDLAESVGREIRVIHEPLLGLSAARRRGFEAATGDIAVLVDDDNVLAPDYLAHVRSLFDAHSKIGLAGGKSLPSFEVEPPAWTREFFPLLALRDLGDAPLVSTGLRPNGAAHNQYPAFAPVGAGMAVRREAWMSWLKANSRRPGLSDRRGAELTSSGDNDIVLWGMRDGWEAAYFPQLRLIHLIPAGRLDATYLARLNRGIQKSWMQVLAFHHASPWPPLSRTGAAMRKLKAWVTHRAWSSPAARIRWEGACGHFDGRVPA